MLYSREEFYALRAAAADFPCPVSEDLNISVIHSYEVRNPAVYTLIPKKEKKDRPKPEWNPPIADLMTNRTNDQFYNADIHKSESPTNPWKREESPSNGLFGSFEERRFKWDEVPKAGRNDLDQEELLSLNQTWSEFASERSTPEKDDHSSIFSYYKIKAPAHILAKLEQQQQRRLDSDSPNQKVLDKESEENVEVKEEKKQASVLSPCPPGTVLDCDLVNIGKILFEENLPKKVQQMEAKAAAKKVSNPLPPQQPQPVIIHHNSPPIFAAPGFPVPLIPSSGPMGRMMPPSVPNLRQGLTFTPPPGLSLPPPGFQNHSSVEEIYEEEGTQQSPDYVERKAQEEENRKKITQEMRQKILGSFQAGGDRTSKRITSSESYFPQNDKEQTHQARSKPTAFNIKAPAFLPASVNRRSADSLEGAFEEMVINSPTEPISEQSRQFKPASPMSRQFEIIDSEEEEEAEKLRKSVRPTSSPAKTASTPRKSAFTRLERSPRLPERAWDNPAYNEREITPPPPPSFLRPSTSNTVHSPMNGRDSYRNNDRRGFEREPNDFSRYQNSYCNERGYERRENGMPRSQNEFGDYKRENEDNGFNRNQNRFGYSRQTEDDRVQDRDSYRQNGFSFDRHNGFGADTRRNHNERAPYQERGYRTAVPASYQSSRREYEERQRDRSMTPPPPPSFNRLFEREEERNITPPPPPSFSRLLERSRTPTPPPEPSFSRRPPSTSNFNNLQNGRKEIPSFNRFPSPVGVSLFDRARRDYNQNNRNGHQHGESRWKTKDFRRADGFHSGKGFTYGEEESKYNERREERRQPRQEERRFYEEDLRNYRETNNYENGYDRQYYREDQRNDDRYRRDNGYY